jgi:hypothetical protein
MKKSDEEKRDIKDRGTIQVLLARFNKQRLPRAEAMKEKVDAGELLSDSELRLIREVHNDAIHIRGLLERHPVAVQPFPDASSFSYPLSVFPRAFFCAIYHRHSTWQLHPF